MATARSIASLTLSFGLVNIPVRLYSAAESGSDIRFNMLAKDGSRLKQHYVSEKSQKVVPRSEMVKGYEVERDHFVLFSPEELKALEEASSHVVDIVAFIPEKSVDPLYYDKAYLLAPDKRGGKPYQLLMAAMRKSGRCALAKWAWKAKQYVVQIRPAEDGLVLQQLRYADEVRMPSALGIEKADINGAELQLALQLIDQIAQDRYDPSQFQDEEKQRVLAAIDQKIAGKEVVASSHPEDAAVGGGQVIDLMAMLQASLGKNKASGKTAPGKRAASPSNVTAMVEAQARKTVKRAPKSAPEVPTPARTRARK
ncbi:Ku protein [Pseudorhodoferax soli]|uniref:Non-homologous end joining protein Ku n=1 Tax=Pseudorhodoferax soli TaxID=545864 RepID=A0A368XNT9_9BURK|nr:Ku protein [Pseudorhodoferax soli]RCW69525.1 DNA end-binding protein Ku [Pseudorhodoferax soli]